MAAVVRRELRLRYELQQRAAENKPRERSLKHRNHSLHIYGAQKYIVLRMNARNKRRAASFAVVLFGVCSNTTANRSEDENIFSLTATGSRRWMCACGWSVKSALSLSKQARARDSTEELEDEGPIRYKVRHETKYV